MSKGQHGNREAKKPKKSAALPPPLPAVLPTKPSPASDRPKKTP